MGRRHCPTGDTPYPAARLARLIRRLEGIGVAVLADADGKRLARQMYAEALYIPEAGAPGVLVLGDRPTCAEVLEELIHIGQHRANRWEDVSASIPRLEAFAQVTLIRKAMRWGWTDGDIARLARAGVRHYERI